MLVNETIGLKLKYVLDQDSANYNKNALEHRIGHATLKAEPVDETGSCVDDTFQTLKINVQSNYAVAVFDRSE